MSSPKASDLADLPTPPIEPRLVGEGIHRVNDVLPGLADLDVAQAIAGDLDPVELFEDACVLCFRGDGYPRVDDHTGHVLCPDDYIRNHDPMIVYLDLVHELVHVRQVRQGQAVYHFPEPYVEWPTEIEAYRITYEEAKRLGVDDDWFWAYLAVPWVEDEEIIRLGLAIGMPRPDDVDVVGDEGVRH